MRILFILLLFIFSNGLYAQFYGHKIFRIGDNNLNVVNVFIDPNDDRVIVPTIYPGDTSTIITFDQQSNDRLDITIPALSFTRTSFAHIDDNNYFYGKNKTILNDLQVIKMDAANLTIWQEAFQTDLDSSFPNDIVAIEDHLYITAVNDRIEPYHREINIKKINTSGQEI